MCSHDRHITFLNQTGMTYTGHIPILNYRYLAYTKHMNSLETYSWYISGRDMLGICQKNLYLYSSISLVCPYSYFLSLLLRRKWA